MSRKPSVPRCAALFCAALACVAVPSAVFAPAAHAQKGRKAAAKKPAGKAIKLADVGLSFVLPTGYGPMTEEQQAKMGAGPENARFFAIGPRTTRFDATKYAAYNATLTTWVYSSVTLYVTPVPGKNVTDVTQMTAEDEEELKRALEGRDGRGRRGLLGAIRVENTARGKVGGKNALFVGGHSDVPGREETFRHRICLIVHEGRLYTFDYATDIESFPTQSRAFERLLASVQWSKPAVPAPTPSSAVAEGAE